MQAKAEVEASRVLKAIGFNEQQSRIFLEINGKSKAPASSSTLLRDAQLVPGGGGGSLASVYDLYNDLVNRSEALWQVQHYLIYTD